MSISVYDIKTASFTSNVKEVDELTLTNKGLVDLGDVGEASNLRALSLAFNSLTSISALVSLKNLQTLNVSHNSVVSLKAIGSLVGLKTLNASHNKIVSGLAGLSKCSQLQYLYIQKNQIKNPEELRALSSLTPLKRLCCTSNPICSSLEADTSRLVLIALSPNLEMLDGGEVTGDDKTSAAKINLADALRATPAVGSLCLAPPSNPSDLNSSLRSAGGGSSSAPLAANRRRGSSPMLSRTPSRNLRSQAGDGSEWLQGEHNDDAKSVRSAVSECTSASRTAKAGRRRGGKAPSAYVISEGSSFMAVLDQLPTFEPPAGRAKRPPMPRRAAAAPNRSSAHMNADGGRDAHGMDQGKGVASEDGGVSEWLRNAVDDDVMSVRSSLSEDVLGTSVPTPRSAIAGRRSASANLGTTPPTPSSSGKSEGPSILSALDNLPKFVTKKLPTTYSVAIVAASVPTKKLFIPSEASQQPVDQIKYTTGSRRNAVTVRHEGSVASTWPNGDLAVTVDVENAEAAASSPQEGGPAFKMLAMSRQAGNVAVSFDSGSGFIQYPNGGIAIMLSQSTGSGTVYSPDGSATLKWTKDGPDNPPHVDVQLDQHMGVRYSPAQDVLTLYFLCESLQCRFRCGSRTGGKNFFLGFSGGDDDSGDPPDFIAKLTS